MTRSSQTFLYCLGLALFAAAVGFFWLSRAQNSYAAWVPVLSLASLSAIFGGKALDQQVAHKAIASWGFVIAAIAALVRLVVAL